LPLVIASVVFSFGYSIPANASFKNGNEKQTIKTFDKKDLEDFKKDLKEKIEEKDKGNVLSNLKEKFDKEKDNKKDYEDSYDKDDDYRGNPSTPVPEPLTLLGSGIALGFGALLKRKGKPETKV
jgi:hypothetical protein